MGGVEGGTEPPSAALSHRTHRTTLLKKISQKPRYTRREITKVKLRVKINIRGLGPFFYEGTRRLLSLGLGLGLALEFSQYLNHNFINQDDDLCIK